MITTEFELPFFMKNFKSSYGTYTHKSGVIVLEVPGFSKEDLRISLENRVVHVEGKKEILGTNYEIDKKFVLPNESLNSEEPITAKIENGLLFLNLNKNKKEKKKEIEIL
jgi:HSP20 family molecular chaperone IbpA